MPCFFTGHTCKLRYFQLLTQLNPAWLSEECDPEHDVWLNVRETATSYSNVDNNWTLLSLAFIHQRLRDQPWRVATNRASLSM